MKAMFKMFKTKLIEPGQCFVKRHNYNRMEHSQFYGYIEDNNPIYYDGSINFVDRYGPYLVHLAAADRLKLLILPYPSADDVNLPEYIEEFKNVHKFNAIELFKICIDMYAGGNTVDINNISLLIDEFVEHLKTNGEFNPNENLLIKIDPDHMKLNYIFRNVSEIFFQSQTIFLSKNSSQISLDFTDKLKKLDKTITVSQNCDYVIANWLESLNLNLDGWIRQIFEKENKKSQEILLFPKSVNKLVLNDGCNCKLLHSTCENKVYVYDKNLSYEPPIKKINITDIRILTYNVHFWSGYNMGTQNTTVYGVIKNIMAINPDIISIQEDNNMLEFTEITDVSYADEYHHMMLDFNNSYEKINGCKYDNKFYNTIFIKKELKKNILSQYWILRIIIFKTKKCMICAVQQLSCSRI